MVRVVRQRRFADAQSEIVWAAIETLDVGLQFALLRELATDFAADMGGNRSMKVRVQRAVLALHEAADLLGHSPSVPEYRQLRASLPELDLPPDANIRKWLGGGWNDCLRRSLLPAVTDGDFASTEVGLTYRLTDEEIFAALRECSAELGHPPSLTEYMQWSRRPDVMARPGRRFRSYRPLERLGGFREALVKAGVIEEDGARFAANGRLLPSSYAYTDAEVKAALLEIAARLSKSPQPGEYQRERDVIREELSAKKLVTALPTAAIIRDRYGTWENALHSVGLPPVASRAPWFKGKQRPSYSTQALVAKLNEAWVDVGDPFTSAAYRAWRSRRMASGEVLIPALPTIERAFGGWTNATRVALPSREAEAGHGSD